MAYSKENKKTDYVLLVTASTIVAGGAEHIAASALTTFLIVLAIAFFINRKNKNFYPENKTRIIKGVFFASVLGAFLLLCISNPGVGIHYIEVHQQSDGFAAHHSVNVLDTINMFCKPHKLIGLALLIACWVLFQNTFKISPIKIHSNYFLSAIFCVAAITAIASILAYHTLSVGRIWFAFDVTVFVVLCVLAIKWVESLKANTITLFVSAGVLLITLALFDIRHVPALLKFSSQHDKLVYSLQQKPAGEQVVLHDFPNPDLTNQVALSADPNNDVNQLFCRFYNIKAKVSVKK